MAQNFKMIIQQEVDGLYIRPTGDFDGSSACELTRVISENIHNFKKIKIDTGRLNKVYPFGREVFNQKFSRIKRQRIRIRFIGPKVL